MRHIRPGVADCSLDIPITALAVKLEQPPSFAKFCCAMALGAGGFHAVRIAHEVRPSKDCYVKPLKTALGRKHLVANRDSGLTKSPVTGFQRGATANLNPVIGEVSVFALGMTAKTR